MQVLGIIIPLKAQIRIGSGILNIWGGGVRWSGKLGFSEIHWNPEVVWWSELGQPETPPPPSERKSVKRFTT